MWFIFLFKKALADSVEKQNQKLDYSELVKKMCNTSSTLQLAACRVLVTKIVIP